MTQRVQAQLCTQRVWARYFSTFRTEVVQASSGRKLDYRLTFSRTERETLGPTQQYQQDAIQNSFFGFQRAFLPPPRRPGVSFAVQVHEIFSLRPPPPPAAFRGWVWLHVHEPPEGAREG